MDLKESDSKILKESGVKKFLKGVVSAVALIAMSVGLVEQTEGRFNSTDCAAIVAAYGAAGFPTLITAPGPTNQDLATWNVTLSNIIAQAVSIPLVRAVRNGALMNVLAGTPIVAATTANILGPIPGPGAPIIGPLNAAIIETMITGVAPGAAAPAVPAVPAVPAAAVAGVPLLPVINAVTKFKLQAARLIVASAIALEEASLNAFAANAAAGALVFPVGVLPGTSNAARRASSAVNDIIAHPPAGLTVNNGAQSVGLALQATNMPLAMTIADRLIKGFFNRLGHAVAQPIQVAAAGTPGIPAPTGAAASRLFEHVRERGHLWEPTAAGAAANQDRIYMSWCRGARFGTGNMPPRHSSFLVPPPLAGNLTGTFANILNSFAAVNANVSDYRGGMNLTANIAPAPGRLVTHVTSAVALENIKQGYFVNAAPGVPVWQSSLYEASVSDTNIVALGSAPQSVSAPQLITEVIIGIRNDCLPATMFPID